MTITRFDPFREFAIVARGNWVPPVDIFETPNHDVVIKAELPDVNREDVEVTVENNVLTLRGEKKLPADVREDQFVHAAEHG
jgi:HSP20 family protein